MQSYFNEEELKEVLTKEEEQHIINQIKNGDKEAKNMLIEHNLRLVLFVARRFESIGRTQEEFNEIIGSGIIGLIKSINGFQSDKNIQFSTFAANCIQNEILMMFRKKGRDKKILVSFDDTICTDNDGKELTLKERIEDTSVHFVEDYEEKELIETLHKKISLLSEQEQYVICNYYGLFGNTPCSQRELAEKIDFSQAYISKILRTALKKLKKEMYMEYNMDKKQYKKTP